MAGKEEDVLTRLEGKPVIHRARSVKLVARSGDVLELMVTINHDNKRVGSEFRFTRPDGTVLTTPVSGDEIRAFRDMLWDLPTEEA